jgi:hypothetical protein
MRNKILVVGAALIAVAAVGSAQSQRAAATLDDVVSELRALRADLRQTTRAGTQVQMLTVRLQLQEQRLAVLSNQRQLVVTKLTDEARQRLEAEAQLKIFQGNEAKDLPAGFPRDQLDAMVNQFKQVVALHKETEQGLRAQEAALSGDIANEQGRWQDFNNRLDELERSLK